MCSSAAKASARSSRGNGARVAAVVAQQTERTDVEDYRAAEEAAISEAAAALDDAGPGEILQWALDRYGDDVSLACSFGGVSSLVMLHMIEELRPSVEVFYIDTDYLFPETLQLVESAQQRWPRANIVSYRSAVTVAEQEAQHGPALWERDPDLCCDIRKVEPNRRALAGKRAWFSGLRRDQSEERASTPAVQWDEKFDLVKVNPLINWDEKRVWAYLFEQDIPYNPLHDQNYPSIGCTNCTRAVLPGEDARAGRWSGQDKTECGLHTAP